MSDILFDCTFYLMEFTASSGQLTSMNLGGDNLVGLIPHKEIVRIS